ncbi:secretory phospholipase A2 receptor-like [Hypomesus transpacificus]|uniref:secretory phospholipase A2 receptor-like n=1 Tax=Hypomesus transpacificus TaxID=137520 RepID=UPI001F073C81|nr:secretory phospholipase A2 receptor-like [Hypomesus transpacificus]
MFSWIGLYREPNNETDWKWSGGGYATYLNFQYGQPNNGPQEFFGGTSWYGWHDYYDVPATFYCLSLFVVREPKTWEEALEYCREQYTDLTSLLSETEMLLAHREIQEQAQTALVWTGLRFLGDRWLWVNGDPVDYQAWPPGGGHQCPARNLRCGAVGTAGHWEAHDCQERLRFICY